MINPEMIRLVNEYQNAQGYFRELEKDLTEYESCVEKTKEGMAKWKSNMDELEKEFAEKFPARELTLREEK